MLRHNSAAVNARRVCRLLKGVTAALAPSLLQLVTRVNKGSVGRSGSPHARAVSSYTGEGRGIGPSPGALHGKGTNVFGYLYTYGIGKVVEAVQGLPTCVFSMGAVFYGLLHNRSFRTTAGGGQAARSRFRR